MSSSRSRVPRNLPDVKRSVEEYFGVADAPKSVSTADFFKSNGQGWKTAVSIEVPTFYMAEMLTNKGWSLCEEPVSIPAMGPEV